MKVFVVLSAVLACAFGQLAYPYAFSTLGYTTRHLGVYPYTTLHAPIAVAAPVVLPTSSQYRAQDVFGQFTFGSVGDNQARVETKTLDGAVRGAYSYIDPTGKNVHVDYLADQNGFRVLGANNLPESLGKAPEPVKETPEVMAARAEFEKKFAEAKGAAPEKMSREKRQAIFYSGLHTPILAAPTPILAAPAPILAKSTLKYNTFETVEAKVPADTKKAELKEKEIEITHPVAPLAYRTVLPSVYSPYHYDYAAVRSPYIYHI